MPPIPGLDLPIDVERLGSGDPVILLHGFGASRFTWRSWVPELSRRRSLYLVDLRGFGSARKDKGVGYGPADMAGDVLALIRRLDLQRITLIGHSMGGGVALMVALGLLDAGEKARLSRLVSVAGTAYAQRLPPIVKKLRSPSMEMLVRILPARWIVRMVLAAIVYDRARVTQEMIDGYTAPLRSAEAKRAAAECATQLIPENVDALAARYPEIDVPALLLWGRQDPVVPLAIGERLSRELPRARLVVLDRCGHIPAEEWPEQTLQTLEAFLDE